MYLGNVGLSCNLQAVYVLNTQIWGGLLMTMQRSVLIHCIFDLIAKYWFDTETLCFQEFTLLHFLELLYFSYLSGQAVKDSSNNCMGGRKLVTHYLGIFSNLHFDKAGVVQLLVCLLKCYHLCYLMLFPIVLLETFCIYGPLYSVTRRLQPYLHY